MTVCGSQVQKYHRDTVVKKKVYWKFLDELDMIHKSEQMSPRLDQNAAFMVLQSYVA